jgi:hypothetical protein
MHRRSVLGTLPLLLLAPSIVRAESLMPIFVPRLTLDDLYDMAAGIGADLVVAHENGRAKAYAVSPCNPFAGKFVFGPYGKGMVLDKSNTIGVGRLISPEPRLPFLARYSTDMPKQVRPDVFHRIMTTGGRWLWQAV